MNKPNRTFVLQAVGVAVVVSVIFFAFLRPTDVGELSGIEAPGDDGPTAGIPGEGPARGNDARGTRRSDPRDSNRRRTASTSASAASGGSAVPPASGGSAVPPASSGSAVPPASDDPADDQYASTVAALMNRVTAPGDP
jgi:hypothetical protein